jgi:polyphosphate kinase 2 (PPK2 family)
LQSIAKNVEQLLFLKATMLLEKGDVIRELSYTWDPCGFEVYPLGPPTAEEASHPFIWGFWNRLPGLGQIAVFDRP